MMLSHFTEQCWETALLNHMHYRLETKGTDVLIRPGEDAKLHVVIASVVVM